jgi:hypothetical protein
MNEGLWILCSKEVTLGGNVANQFRIISIVVLLMVGTPVAFSQCSHRAQDKRDNNSAKVLFNLSIRTPQPQVKAGDKVPWISPIGNHPQNWRLRLIAF